MRRAGRFPSVAAAALLFLLLSMNAPSQSDEARDNACLENTLVCNLPMELVLGILDAAIVQHRRTDLFWSLTLSLVCSAVRASALSIIYETIFWT